MAAKYHSWKIENWGLLFLMLSTLITGITGIVLSLRIIGQPFGGFLTTWRGSNNRFTIHTDTPTTWPSLRSGALNIGDIILAVNGEPPTNAIGIYNMLSFMPVDNQRVTYIILRNGSNLVEELPLYIFTMKDFLDVRLPPLLLAFSCWSISIIVYLANPNKEVNKVCTWAYIVSANTALLLASTIFTLPLIGNKTLTLVLDLLTYGIFAPFLGPVHIHFSLVFPETSRPKILYRYLFLLYFPAVIVAGLNVYIKSSWQVWSPLLSLFDKINIIYLAISILFGFSFAIGRYIFLYTRTRSVRTKKQLMIIAGGWFFGLLLPGIPYIFHTIVGKWIMPGFANTTALFLAVIPVISYSYAILRYQSFRYRSNSLTFLTILFISIILAFFISIITEPLINQVPYLFLLLLTCLITSVIWRTNNPIKDLFTRLQEKEATFYHILDKFVWYINTSTDVPIVEEKIALSLLTHLEVKRVLFWQPQTDLTVYRASDRSGITEKKDVEISPALTTALEENFKNNSQPILVNYPNKSLSRQLKSLFEVQNIEAVIPLVNENTLLGFVGIGNRWTEEIFDEKDINLLSILGRQIILAILVSQQK